MRAVRATAPATGTDEFAAAGAGGRLVLVAGATRAGTSTWEES